MTRRLIVTADDFGASVTVNEAVEEAFLRGVLTTTSLMVAAEAADDAIARARRLPGLRVGLHLVVVRGRPLLPPEQVPALVGRNGLFLDALLSAGINFFLNPWARRQLHAEVRAQFEAFRRTGLELDHVNAHNHMHLHPTVLGAIMRIGEEYGLRAIRMPFEPPSAEVTVTPGRLDRLAASLLWPWLSLMRVRLRRARFVHNDFVFGMHDSGRMHHQRVLTMLADLPEGVSEMHFHPATSARDHPFPGRYLPSQELEALTSMEVSQFIEQSGIELVSFRDLAPMA